MRDAGLGEGVLLGQPFFLPGPLHVYGQAVDQYAQGVAEEQAQQCRGKGQQHEAAGG